MFRKILVYLKNFDWILFFGVVLLATVGLAEIYSVAAGQTMIGESISDVQFANFRKQIMFIVIGLALVFGTSLIDYHFIRSYSNHLYIIGFGLLVAVLFLGQEIRGTTGWFYIGNFGIQPVEIIKIIVIVFLSYYFSKASLKSNPIKHLLISGGGVFLLIGLVLAQPDFGSAMILFLLWLAMIAAAGFEKKYFVIIGLMAAVALAGSWAFMFENYQKQRIITFLSPAYNPLDQGYNVAQAIIAVGSGGLTGRGIGFGSQSQLKFLPESQNDFIFAVIAEEMGFLGIMLVVLFYGVFFLRSMTAIRKINNDFAIFFILGGVSLIFIEMFINIGMNIGILPVVGISLPFVSYGGSGLVSKFLLVGIIESIIVRTRLNY